MRVTSEMVVAACEAFKRLEHCLRLVSTHVDSGANQLIHDAFETRKALFNRLLSS